MAKKKAGKALQMMSPANYIRTRARNLPVYECVINSDWEETQLARLVIARKHSNGNITAGIYLVDLLCLGVKDTHYLFNISEVEYRDFLHGNTELIEDGVRIDYNLAHNIVFAGLEFAEEFGFKPYKDFNSTTQYILDEDTDDIPLIEIVCGIDGIPALLPDLWDDRKALSRVISQLENKVGFGNFLLLRRDGRVMHSMDDEEDDDFDDGFLDFSLEEKVELFEELMPRFVMLDDEERERFNDLVDSLSTDLFDQERYNQHYYDLSGIALAIEVDPKITPDELLNGASGQFSEETKLEFLELVEAAFDPQVFNVHSKKFKAYEGADAANGFLDFLVTVSNRQDVEATEQIKILAAKYPDYTLVQLKYAKFNFLNEEGEAESISLLEPSHFFGDRKVVHPLEYFYYMDYLTGKIITEANFDKICAWKDLIVELPASVEEIELIEDTISMFQPFIVAGIIDEGKHLL